MEIGFSYTTRLNYRKLNRYVKICQALLSVGASSSEIDKCV
ncbi:hypothetical protein PS673_04245 [Pseudomonas fluorescens]|uniref:Uncharacterized protein n=1 Tax=Pseudomonas fluorescens TaxID=294 RepID=A0A5E7RET3_PSEFL|nr:hypothetical protein PS673_04245 [Pseudomonas fluorescens]VVP72669.1 hypothetical protein PS922_00952 [Pseudomonas fluorescens]